MELLGPPLFWVTLGRGCGGNGLAGSEPVQGSLPHCPQGRGDPKQTPVRVCGPGASPLETFLSTFLSLPFSQPFQAGRLHMASQPGKNHRIMNEGQGYGMERVEGRPALRRRDPWSAPLVCFWILSLQAEEEDPSGDYGPSLPRKRYLQRA